MAKKVLSAVLTMQDKNFSSGIKKASQGVNGFDKRVKYAGNQVKKFRDNAVSNFSSVVKSAAGLAAAYVGFSKLSSFLGETVEAAKAQIDAETKLAAVMKNTKGVTDKQIQSVKAYASEVQNMGVIGDEVQLSGVQQLATFQLQGDTLKKLMPGMADLIAQQKGLGATQQDAVTIGNMFGKVMNGQVGALSRAGINFTKAQEKVLKYGTESEKAATLAEVLKMNVGGVNAALADTDQGRIQQMTNAWGDYKEEVGKKILPLQAQLAGWFFKQIPKIQGFVLGAIDKGVAAFEKAKPIIGKLFDGLKPGIAWVKDVGFPGVKTAVSEIYEKAQPTIGWLKDTGLPALRDGIGFVIEKATGLYNFFSNNWSAISPIVYGVVAAIAAYKAGIVAVTIAQNVWKGVTTTLTIAQGLLNGAIAISPLGWIAIAIGAVVAAGVLLYKNWDTVKEKAGQLWTWLTEKFQGIKDSVTTSLQPVMDFFTKLKDKWDNFKNAISNFKMPKIGLPKWMGGKGLIQGSFAVGTNRVPRDMVAQIHKDEMIVPAGPSRILRKQGVTIDNITSPPQKASFTQTINRTETSRVEKSGKAPVSINIYPNGLSAREVLNELVPELKLILENL